MSSLNRKFLLLGLTLIFSISNAYAESINNQNFSASPTIALSQLQTDKRSYSKGETVTVRGNDFFAAETISVSVDNFSNFHKQNFPLMNWNVIADENGNFVFQIPFDSLYSESGQFTVRAAGKTSGFAAETDFAAMLPNAANLDQCANGPFNAPTSCTGSNWQNGNVSQSQGHYYEGESIPYRLKFDSLSTGAGNPHTVTIEWDTTQGGKHAIDYITSYNRTEVIGNNPCSGVVPACGVATTFPIPIDPNVTNAGVTQLGGQVFTMWGGTITGVSAYTLSGSYLGNSSTRITLTFIANQSNPVLAWGGHIADKHDWANFGGSASDISGSPYHTRLIEIDGSGGNQDRGLSNSAIRLNTKITIITQASPESSQMFGYSTTNPAFTPNITDSLLFPFSLFDDGIDNDGTPNKIVFTNLLASNASGLFTVSQNANSGFYSLVSIFCTVNSGGSSTTTTSLAARLASININYGDSVTCTFNNQVSTAANASVTGRTIDGNGRAIPNTRVMIQNVNTLETRSTMTNSFGYYSFDDLESGQMYVVTVKSKRYAFSQDTQTFVLSDAVENLDFIADER